VGEVKTYTDSGQTINIGVNQEFVIALGSNPTTGYGWQESYDEAMLELVEKTYEPGKEAKEGMVGAGGVESFRFKVLKTGEAEITLVYKQPWEEPTPQDITKVFTVSIK
jgi:inhibitor of cysteine peptidase